MFGGEELFVVRLVILEKKRGRHILGFGQGEEVIVRQ